MEQMYASLSSSWHELLPVVQVFLVSIFLFFVFNFLLELLRHRLLKSVVSPRQKHTINAFSRFLRYLLIFALVVFTFLSISSSLKELGLTFGILSAAIGFALQGPITGVAAWVMLIIKRPFGVGDRVTIGTIKGNVKEISMTHVYLEEVGRYGGEEVSGRTVIIANGKLFSENIINYSFDHDLILGQVIFVVTYESDIDESERLAVLAVTKHTDHFNKQAKKEAHIRMQFTLNGMEIHARYFAPFNVAQVISTKITHDLYQFIHESKTVFLSYQQHMLHNRK